MAKTFDRTKAEKILNDYPSDEWDDETRRAFLGELEGCYIEDARLAAIRNHVEEKIASTGLYNGTTEWTIYGILQDGLPIPTLAPVVVAPVSGRTTLEQVTVSVQGVTTTLENEEAQSLIRSLQEAIEDSTANAAKRTAELKKLTGKSKKGSVNNDKKGQNDGRISGDDEPGPAA